MTPAGMFAFLTVMVLGLFAVDAALTAYLRWCDRRGAQADERAEAMRRWRP